MELIVLVILIAPLNISVMVSALREKVDNEMFIVRNKNVVGLT